MAIDKLPVPSPKVDHRDTRLKGLVLRVMPSGAKSWYCEYVRGKRVWLGRADVLGVTEARESARAILADVYRGIDPIEARKPKPVIPTYRVFLETDYSAWAKSSQKAHGQNIKRLFIAFKTLLDKPLDKFTALDVERWRAGEVERGLSNQTINRHIPLNREATLVMLNWRAQSEDTSGLVFVIEQGERFDRANSSWRRLLKDAQITAFRWHDMRHDFASRLAMGGVDLNSIRELLGHSDYAMTLRYAHLAPEYKLKAVEVLDAARDAAAGRNKVLALVR